MGWLRPGSNALLPVFGFSMGELDLMKKRVYPAIFLPSLYPVMVCTRGFPVLVCFLGIGNAGLIPKLRRGCAGHISITR